MFGKKPVVVNVNGKGISGPSKPRTRGHFDRVIGKPLIVFAIGVIAYMLITNGILG